MDQPCTTHPTQGASPKARSLAVGEGAVVLVTAVPEATAANTVITYQAASFQALGEACILDNTALDQIQPTGRILHCITAVC